VKDDRQRPLSTSEDRQIHGLLGDHPQDVSDRVKGFAQYLVNVHRRFM